MLSLNEFELQIFLLLTFVSQNFQKINIFSLPQTLYFFFPLIPFRIFPPTKHILPIFFLLCFSLNYFPKNRDKCDFQF